jgi:hypothetical protein
MNTMRKLQASASAVACAAAACLATFTAPPALASTSCVPAMLIGVHGTGEETGVIGNELASLYNGVVAHTGLPEQGLNGWSDDSSLMSDLGAGVAVYLVNQDPSVFTAAVNKLQAAVNAGETDLYNQVTSEESNCPGERFVIAGFSQGAMVVGQFARDHPSLSAGSGGPVSGIIMWADPEFNGNDSLSKGADPGGSVFISSSGWLGFIGWYYNQRYTFPSAWSGRLHSYCTSDDGVCDWNPINAPKLVNRHGDENQTPAITTDSNKAIQGIQGQGSGWAPSVWDVGGTNDFYTKWQSLGGTSGPLGQPTADAYSDSSGWHQVFQGGRIDNGVVTYNDCNAGRFSNGSIDQGILNAYLAAGGQSSLGCPFNNGGGVFVHYWSGPQANVQDFTGGSFGPAVMVDGPQGTFFVNYGFRTAYISGGYNSTCLAPINNAYGYSNGTRQDFVNCYMTWTSSGGVVVHGPSPTSCTDYGGTLMTGPNACIGFTIPSNSGAWFSGSGVGLFGKEIWTYGNGTTRDSYAVYTLHGLDTTHAYTLQAYIPNGYSDASHAHYHYCGTNDGCADGYVNQNNFTNAWASFGTVCTTDGNATITLADDGGDVYPAVVGADAIRGVRTGIVC